MSLWPTYRISRDGKRIDGMYLHAFIHNGEYFLTEIGIYQDGMIECWEWVDFEGFKQRVHSGWVVTQLPPDARVSVFPLGTFRASDITYEVYPEEFIKEVADEIEALNGRSTTSERCRAAWATYKASPSDTAKEALRICYEAVPRHLRYYLLGDMGKKDSLIRMVLYPSVEHCRRVWNIYQDKPDDFNREALRIAYEAVPKDKRADAVCNEDIDDAQIRRVLYPKTKVVTRTP